MSCLDHTPDKQYLGHIFEHCQRVRWALHPILLNLHTLWNRPAHPSPLALKTERNLHPLCGKGVQSYQNHHRFSRKTSGIATIPEVFWCLSIVVFHALRTLPFHLVSHMAVDIQCERRRGVAEVALHCLHDIAGADSCDGI